MIIMMIKSTKRTQLNLVCAGFHYSYTNIRVINIWGAMWELRKIGMAAINIHTQQYFEERIIYYS